MPRSSRIVYVVLALIVPFVVGGRHAIAVERPPPLATPSGCELWVGRASGNDPSTQLELQLCPQPDGSVAGALQWSSTVSGWNVRDVSGRVQPDGTTLFLRDDRVREERPEPGWRFCTVDRYTLARSGDRMTGRYHSAACQDDGTITLRLSGNIALPNAVPHLPGDTANTPPPPSQPTPPTPSQPNPSQPTPLQPNPSQPNPLQPNPTQPNPLQPNPTQPNPLQPTPVQPTPPPPERGTFGCSL